MSLKIVFMGTPEFSIPSLKILKSSRHKIISVYTQPPKKKSRGQKILKSAVHIFSENEGINVRTNNLKDEREFEEFKQLNPDLVIVVAYGQIIPDVYFNNPHLIKTRISGVRSFTIIFPNVFKADNTTISDL